MGKMWPSHLATCKIVWNRYWYLSSVWLTEEVYWELCSARKVLWGRRCWLFFCSVVSPSLGVGKLRFVLIILHYPSAAGDHKSFTVRAAWRTFFHGGRKKRLLFSTSIYVSIFLLLAFLFCTLPFEKMAVLSFRGYKCGLLDAFHMCFAFEHCGNTRMEWEKKRKGEDIFADCFLLRVYSFMIIAKLFALP